MFSVFEWFVLVLWCDAFVLIVLSDEPMQNQGRGLVDYKLVKAPSKLLAVRRRHLCFGSLVVFRCCVPLFIVVLVIY